jgi:hypothetical protein
LSKLSKVFLFLQDNVAPHKAVTTHQKLADHHSEVLKHMAYSTYFAPSDFYLFPNCIKHLEVRQIPSIEEAILVAVGWFAAQPKEFFFYELKKFGKKVIIVWSSEGICRVNTFLQSRSLLFST